ncbi:hypothetical protein [Staphylococcus phage PMBT8]|nr:hypothetical protein [Staphylococcus phage PMBT8]
MENPEQKLVNNQKEVELPESHLSKWDEQILVLEKRVLEDIGMMDMFFEQDIITTNVNDSESYKAMTTTLNKLWSTAGDVKRRGDMEEDFNYLQPIPSILLKQGDKFFTYTRLSGSGETRLHNKTSLTVGGHMNLETEEYWNFEHLLALGACRELEEEVFILDETGNEIENHYELAKKSQILGLGYTDKTDVDKVHLAIYMAIEIPRNYQVLVKETDSLKGDFKTLEEARTYDLENWSKMIADVIKVNGNE